MTNTSEAPLAVTTTEFIDHIAAATQTLLDHRDEVNRLNVFPVPDGDTGTNMALTMESVMHELAGLPEPTTLSDIRRAVTHGSLMGARGNSGVITSQILRGICDGVAAAEYLDAATIALALARAVEVAFSAVRKPVEGTILTVLRDVAEGAQRAATEGLGPMDTLQALSREAFDSVNRTPDLLPVLKENKVVDAGGYGFALMIEGFVASIAGTQTAAFEHFLTGKASPTGPKVAIEQIDDWEGSSYLYCTEFLLNSADLALDDAHEFLARMGDCELLVGAHPDFKVHVHTNEPGTVLTYMTERGQVAEVHIHNMRLQSAERLKDITRDSESPESSPSSDEAAGTARATDLDEAKGPEKQIAFIAVASGEGMERILHSLGVDRVVSGGQTMNPSTQDLLQAIDQVNASKVIIFPNNKNIILAANAAAEVSEKTVVVVPTRSVPESFSALFVADLDASLADNAEAMQTAIAEMHSGELTRAIKDAKTAKGAPICEGDIIGIADDSIEVVGSDLVSVAITLVGIIAEEADTLTILAGRELSDSDFEDIIARIKDAYPELEIDAHRGEQPLYPLVMAAE
ncbi:MAG: DAK2 domain-containing protein [Coriobacteriales bacterium]|jgi:DAK2 domain fusion protein YloV|nr:DAK2 domain-containing protein [Coriobacteriales bacterium]